MVETNPLKAILVVVLTALLCSLLVSATAVYLRPMQQAYADIERIAVIVELSGLLGTDSEPTDVAIISAYRELEPALIDLESDWFDASRDPEEFLGRLGADAVQQVKAITPELDIARLGNRPRWLTVFRVEDNTGLQRLIVPIYGQGMWSTIHGYLALEADLNTIASVVFYELGETAGIGDRITRADWLANWRGKKLYDEAGLLRFNIGAATVPAGTANDYHVDGIAGATVTVTGVSNLVRYWFGPDGYAPFLRRLASETAR